jgi:copper chaperone
LFYYGAKSKDFALFWFDVGLSLPHDDSNRLPEPILFFLIIRQRVKPMKLEFQVQNVKCQGCASAIREGLGQHPQVREVRVDVPTGQVIVETTEDVRKELSGMLRELGYPEKA